MARGMHDRERQVAGRKGLPSANSWSNWRPSVANAAPALKTPPKIFWTSVMCSPMPVRPPSFVFRVRGGRKVVPWACVSIIQSTRGAELAHASDQAVGCVVRPSGFGVIVEHAVDDCAALAVRGIENEVAESARARVENASVCTPILLI